MDATRPDAPSWSTKASRSGRMVYVLAMLRAPSAILPRTPDRCRSAADVVAGVAPAEARQDLVADGAGAAADLVDREVGADQRREIAALYRAGRHLGDVDDDQVHRHAPGEGAVQPGNDGGAGGHLRVALRVGGARGARVAVGIADRQHREPPRPVRGPLGVVADRLAVGRGPDLDDAALKPDHRSHRVAAAGSR